MLLCGLAGTVRLFVVDSFPGLPKEQSKINLYDREPTQYTCQKLLFQDVLGAIWGSHIYIYIYALGGIAMSFAAQLDVGPQPRWQLWTPAVFIKAVVRKN